MNDKIPELEDKLIDGENTRKDMGDEGSSGEDVCDVIFKVKLEKPEPQEVKISKKNVCLVTIVKGEEEQQEEDDR